MNSTGDFHDELVFVIIVSEVGSLLDSVMIEDDKIKHESTNKIRYIPGGVSDATDEIGGNREVELFAILSERLEIKVVEFVVLFYFILDIFVVFKEGD